MQCLGKLDGPECRIENIMDFFILPIIFSIRAAISILLLLQDFFLFRTVKTFIDFLFRIIQDFYQWMRFISWIAISSYTGHFWWMVLQLILQVVFIVPITFHGFFWYVYNFGPEHRKRSLYDILLNPVPGEEFEARLGESDDFKSLRH
jgi:hypothetical protein